MAEEKIPVVVVTADKPGVAVFVEARGDKVQSDDLDSLIPLEAIKALTFEPPTGTDHEVTKTNNQNDQLDVSTQLDLNQAHVPVSEPEPPQLIVETYTASPELQVQSREVPIFEGTEINGEIEPEPSPLRNEAKSLRETVEHVLTILNPEPKDEVVLENLTMMVEHQEGITVIAVEETFILGVQETNEGEDELQEAELTPVDTLSELGKTLDKAMFLIRAHPIEDQELPEMEQMEEEEHEPDIVILVSQDLLKLIESMRKQDILTEEEEIVKEDEEKDQRKISFVVDGELPQTLIIKERELVELRVLLGIDMMTSEPRIQPENDEKVESTPINTIFRLSETLKSLNLSPLEDPHNDEEKEPLLSENSQEDGEQSLSANSQEEEQTTPETALFVSDEIMTFIEKLRQKLPKPSEFSVKHEATDQTKGEKESENSDREMPQKRKITFMTKSEDAKRLVIDEQDLLQLQQSFIEHDLNISLTPPDENELVSFQDEQKMVGVGVIIQNLHGDFLLQREVATVDMLNQLSLVGGGVNIHESVRSAVIRKVKEETELDLQGIRFVKKMYFNEEWDAMIFHGYVDTEMNKMKLKEDKELEFYSENEIRALIKNLPYYNPFLQTLGSFIDQVEY